MFVIAVLLGAGTAVCWGQNESVVKGRVVEMESGEPLGFATVAIVRQDSGNQVSGNQVSGNQVSGNQVSGNQKGDNAAQGGEMPAAGDKMENMEILAGCMAAEDGTFELKAPKGGNVIVVSLVGYKDARKEISVSGTVFDAGAIALEEDMLALEGAVVQAQLPRTELKGDAIVTNIAGSVLEHAGNAQDLIAKIPGMFKRDGKLEVIGRGEPVYYINGRRVLDNDELRSLMSEEVKSIDVVNNPGAAYGAEIKAVVRIKTIRRQGEGFSYALTSQAKKYLYIKDFDPSWTVLDLNYRKGNVDFIGKVTYWDQHNYQFADIIETSFNPEKTFAQDGTLSAMQHSNGLNVRFGVNWQINENHSVGFQAEKKNLLYGRANEIVEENVFLNGSLVDHLVSAHPTDLLYEESWNGNMYYNGQVGDLEIDFNTDFQTGGSGNRSIITEESQLEPRTISTQTESSTDMIASKLVFRYPVWKGQLQAGAEESFVRTWQENNITFEEIAPSNSEIRENTIAGFAEYALPFKFGQLSAGVRYEHVDFAFADFIGNDDLDRKQDNWFPSASFSTKIGKVGLSASVSGKTQRPNFWQLSNEMQYHSRFTYQVGDPTLKNEKYLDAALNLNWKWLTFSGTYDNIKDAVDQLVLPYNDEEVALVKYVNLADPLNVYSAYLAAAPTIGCWNPQYTVGVRKQKYEMTAADYREPSGFRVITYNRPMYMLQLNNSFRLKKNWELSADYQFRSRMSYGAYDITNATNALEFSVQKSFLKDNAMTVRLTASDVLNGSVEKIHLDYGQLDHIQINDYKSPGLILRVSYHFNTASNKYKGTGAGDSVRSRL